MNSQFLSVVPVIHVSDLENGIAFFTNIGFKKDWAWGQPECYAGMSSAAGQVIHLQHKDEVTPASAGLYIRVVSADEAFTTCQKANLEVISPLQNQEYGTRDFTITGPDGIYVTFGQDIN